MSFIIYAQVVLLPPQPKVECKFTWWWYLQRKSSGLMSSLYVIIWNWFCIECL